MIHIGNNVARLRGFRRLTQKHLASSLGMTQQEYSRLEGKEEIDEDLLKRIAEAMDFPVDLIKQLDSGSVVNHNQQGGNAGNIFYQYSQADQVTELYEKLLKEKDEIIALKESMIAQKDELIKLYQSQQKTDS